MNKEYVSTGKAARMLGVTPTTLRSWDKKGKLTSIRTPGGRRLFSVKKIRIFLGDALFDLSFDWAATENPEQPNTNFSCTNSAIFKSRLMRLEQELKRNQKLARTYSLITAAAGEIGNNSFDHNLGNWPDISGVFFGYDSTKGEIVLADRGQGILKTLKRVKPTLKNDKEALYTAFTKIISGRAPEERGNGLKFVRKATLLSNMEIFFQSGNAVVSLSKQQKRLEIEATSKPIQGCFAYITFQN